LIDGSPFEKRSIVELTALLPTDDAVLDEWLAEAVRQQHQKHFFHLAIAALHGERTVDACHLVGGLMIIPHHMWYGSMVWKMRGEVAEHIAAALHGPIFYRDGQGFALYVAALWHREHRDGSIPAALVTHARSLARVKELELSSHAMLALFMVGELAQDEGLTGLLRKRAGEEKFEVISEKACALMEESLSLFQRPILELVHETAPDDHLIARGKTMRRAVDRISRNDPCPCGSGRKYKRCCAGKDQERLRHSTDVRGKTREELLADLEPHLTHARLGSLQPHEVARLDPARIPKELLPEYLSILGACSLFDRAAEAVELIGCDEALRPAFENLIWYATYRGRRDSAIRLLALHPHAAEADGGHIRFITALLVADENLEAKWARIERQALEALTGEDPADELYELAFGMLLSPRFRAMGILLARAAIPHISKSDAGFLLDQVLDARDRLRLSPDDPASDLLEQRFADEPPADDGRNTAALRAARAKLEKKAAEVRRMKAELERMRREVARQEKKRAEPMPAAAPPTEADETRLRELRDKVRELKGTLNERHEERTVLRRELLVTHADLKKLRSQPEPSGPEPASAEDEERHLLAGEMPGNQPARVIEFPRKFHETLRGFSRPVARSAMAMLGRLAGGEAAAFVGVVRLKDCPETLRQRIGIDHRLLFRLHSGRLEVVDLINRRDLERRIKTLG
jgi:hypothetical protein